MERFLTNAHHGPAFFAYSNNYLIDTDHAIILDVQASRSVRTGEIHATRTMIDRVRDRFDLWPERLIADTAYGSGAMLGWLVEERGIEPHIPVIDKSRRTGRHVLPRGLRLRPRDGYLHLPGRQGAAAEVGVSSRPSGTSPRTPASPSTARSGRTARPAHLKDQCCPKGTPRRIMRSEHEGARQMARDIAKTEDYAISCKLRKKVEMLFAHLKRILGPRSGCDCAAQPVRTTNSSSPLPPRTSESSQSSLRWRRRRSPSEGADASLLPADPHLNAATAKNDFFNGVSLERPLEPHDFLRLQPIWLLTTVHIEANLLSHCRRIEKHGRTNKT